MKKFRIPRKKKKHVKKMSAKFQTCRCALGAKFDIQIEQNENDINRFDVKIRRV